MICYVLYIIYKSMPLKIDLGAWRPQKRMLLHWAWVSFSLPQGTSEGLFEDMNMEYSVPLPHPTPWAALQNYAKFLVSKECFQRTHSRDKISIKGIWRLGPKNHISYHSQKIHLFSGVQYICESPKHQLFFPSNIITTLPWKYQTFK